MKCTPRMFSELFAVRTIRFDSIRAARMVHGGHAVVMCVDMGDTTLVRVAGHRTPVTKGSVHIWQGLPRIVGPARLFPHC